MEIKDNKQYNDEGLGNRLFILRSLLGDLEGHRKPYSSIFDPDKPLSEKEMILIMLIDGKIHVDKKPVEIYGINFYKEMALALELLDSQEDFTDKDLEGVVAQKVDEIINESAILKNLDLNINRLLNVLSALKDFIEGYQLVDFNQILNTLKNIDGDNNFEQAIKYVTSISENPELLTSYESDCNIITTLFQVSRFLDGDIQNKDKLIDILRPITTIIHPNLISGFYLVHNHFRKFPKLEFGNTTSLETLLDKVLISVNGPTFFYNHG